MSERHKSKRSKDYEEEGEVKSDIDKSVSKKSKKEKSHKKEKKHKKHSSSKHRKRDRSSSRDRHKRKRRYRDDDRGSRHRSRSRRHDKDSTKHHYKSSHSHHSSNGSYRSVSNDKNRRRDRKDADKKASRLSPHSSANQQKFIQKSDDYVKGKQGLESTSEVPRIFQNN